MSLPAPLKAVFRYVRAVLKATDMLGNAITGGNAGETISYRSALARSQGSRFACVLCRVLDLFQRDHCGIVLRSGDKTAAIHPSLD